MANIAPADPQAKFLERIERHAFPCVGAKSALAHDGIEFFEAGDLRSGECDEALVARIQQFADQAEPDALFVSFIALFPRTPRLGEAAFEASLWERLQALHRLDAKSFRWDESVSSDPRSPQFSMSLGGRAFYVIGVHPGASRKARRFGCAALVFNLHSQFETLREDGRYERLRAAIVERDIAYSGTSNPMLAEHGEASEARQYSGREVGAQWRCPFSAQRE